MARTPTADWLKIPVFFFLFLLLGTGEKLGDIPRTWYQIAKMKPADLKPLHAILFDRPGKVGASGAGFGRTEGLALSQRASQPCHAAV